MEFEPCMTRVTTHQIATCSAALDEIGMTQLVGEAVKYEPLNGISDAKQRESTKDQASKGEPPQSQPQRLESLHGGMGGDLQRQGGPSQLKLQEGVS